KQALTKQLLKSGAPISEMNCVRKHISQIKGGKLAAAVYPAKLLTLSISDVPGDNPDEIGSGPTVADRSTLADARAAWRALWQPTGLVPPSLIAGDTASVVGDTASAAFVPASPADLLPASPAAMTDWLRQRRDVLKLLAEADAAALACDETMRERDAARDLLRRVLPDSAETASLAA
ncbi:MAG: DUF4147 domain-containing protein, partial [Rhodospirillales bacterium]|nr:DUF4147 domain-containing protein [Rhodospirillales bacterium]